MDALSRERRRLCVGVVATVFLERAEKVDSAGRSSSASVARQRAPAVETLHVPDDWG